MINGEEPKGITTDEAEAVMSALDPKPFKLNRAQRRKLWKAGRKKRKADFRAKQGK